MRAVFISLCAASNSPRRGFDMLSSSSYVHSATLHDPPSFLPHSQTHIQPPRRYAGKIDSIQELAAPRRTVPSHVSFWFGVLVSSPESRLKYVWPAFRFIGVRLVESPNFARFQEWYFYLGEQLSGIHICTTSHCNSIFAHVEETPVSRKRRVVWFIAMLVS